MEEEKSSFAHLLGIIRMADQVIWYILQNENEGIENFCCLGC
jgi:hypothetical protein